jgi:putative transposase
MYNWRKMTNEQREFVLKNRKLRKEPYHSLPHISKKGLFNYHISAACYEHKHIISRSLTRISNFDHILIKNLQEINIKIFAYSILPNHYHLLLETENITLALKTLFKLHQKTGYNWNIEDKTKGRKVWCNAMEHRIKSERHFWATVNYIHNNSIKHGYVEKWSDWPFSSASDYLKKVGYDEAVKIWKEYDISKMGDWDI